MERNRFVLASVTTLRGRRQAQRLPPPLHHTHLSPSSARELVVAHSKACLLRGHTPHGCSCQLKPLEKSCYEAKGELDSGVNACPCFALSPKPQKAGEQPQLRGEGDQCGSAQQGAGGHHHPALGNWQPRERTSFGVMRRRNKKKNPS